MQEARRKLPHTMKSLEFYTGFIGLHEVRRTPLGGDVFLSDEDEFCFAELTYNHDPPDYTLGDQYGRLAIEVPDLDAVEAEVKRRGWEYRPSRPELKSRFLFVCDPDGCDVEIIKRRAMGKGQ